jgi:DNA-binding response OmpR family regulator
MHPSDDEFRPHILIVEDNALISAMVAEALMHAGFEVTAVTAGEDALGLAVMDVPFDALFTDIDLAGPMNGWELAESIREMRPGVPVLYASACADDTAARVPGSVFISKPYSPVALCASLRQLLKPVVCEPDIAPAAPRVGKMDRPALKLLA